MEKVKKNFRLSSEIVQELEQIAQTLGISETEAVSRAIHAFYLQMKREEQMVVSGSIVPLSKYEQVQERLSQLLYRVGELEGRLKEKDETIKAKEDLIRELRRQVEEYKAKPIKKWWEFWR